MKKQLSTGGETTDSINHPAAELVPAVADELVPDIYNALRRIAQSYLNRERPNHTLQATALVHEAYLRLVNWQNITWQSRVHFLAMAAQMMRQVLIDYARENNAQKRSGRWRKIPLLEAARQIDNQDVNLLALSEALEALAVFDEQAAKVVELRFFGGLTIEETAEVLNVSPATVKREWAAAKFGWLTN